MIEFLRAPDDERVERGFQADIIAEVAERPLPVAGYQVGRCVGCGAWLALWTPTRCLNCDETRRWADSNRHFCAFIHRDAPGRG